LFNHGELYSRLERSRVEVDVADEATLGLLSLVRRMCAIFRKWRPDLIHVHGFKENLIAGLAARMVGIPVIRTHHGRGMIGANRRYTYIERFSAAVLTDMLIAVSNDLAEFLRLNGVSPGKLRVVWNGIRCRPEPARQAEASGGSRSMRPFTIGTVGRLVAVKNQVQLLDAFKIVSEEVTAARLVIVGDGPLEAHLKDHATRLGISDRVLFAGFQKDVSSYLEEWDVFVLCSLHEGVPLSLLEAMRMGTPAVCTRVGGIPEVIKDRCNGLLVAANDAKTLSMAIVELSANSSLARQLATNAMATLREEFSLDRCVADTVSLYRDIALK